jgi:UDP-3-O-[3-hydroxymyristoyl] N-acetylglucosamine deacetylase/3-hydroxyacyl-[acyl-carrier-protein] dehydratase
MADYEKDIAPARHIRVRARNSATSQSSLIKGGNLDNAIVIYERELPQHELDELV